MKRWYAAIRIIVVNTVIKLRITSVAEVVGQLAFLYTVGRNVEWYAYFLESSLAVSYEDNILSS